MEIQHVPDMLGDDFYTNKCVCEEITVIPRKKLRNKIAEYVTSLRTVRMGQGR